MERRDTLNLVERIAHLCPAMRIEEGTADAWHAVIGHLDGEDALAACRLVAQRKPFISPSDIIETVSAIRARRLDEANHIFEPRPDETPEQQADRLRRERHAAASRALPGPARLALTAPTGPVQLPSTIGKLVADVRASRNHPALKVRCPWEACHAGPGRWCEKHASGARPGKRPVTGFLHPSRVEAARAEAS